MSSKDIEELKAALQDLLSWKERQESNQTDRLNIMRNDIVDVFTRHHAVTSEMLTVLEIIRSEATANYVTSQKAVKPAYTTPPG